MQRRTADGGITTTDEQVMHYPHPCVPHSPDVSCRDAQANYRRYGTRTLKPQPRRVPDANPYTR